MLFHMEQAGIEHPLTVLMPRNRIADLDWLAPAARIAIWVPLSYQFRTFFENAPLDIVEYLRKHKLSEVSA
jgi:hypothetical protein